MKKRTTVEKKNKQIKEDTRSGSLAYNRLDLQVSQAIHMAVELFKDSDYLFVLDHYDDITVFNKENLPSAVSYYQVKSHEEAITISTVIREEWLSKMYLHMNNKTWNVEELGLITPCILKINASKKDNIKEQVFNGEKTAFNDMDQAIQQKIRNSIANALSLPAEEVDLSKFVHMRTTLTISKHRDLAEQSVNAFLRKTYPNITLEMAKTIFNSFVDILSQRQAYEGLTEKSDFETVRKYKGVSKNDFNRVIDSAMIVCIPSLEDIFNWSNYHESERKELSLAYLQVMGDEQKKMQIQKELFKKIDSLVVSSPKDLNESVIEYSKRIQKRLGMLPPVYNDLYILVVVTSILINHWRRK